jgi:DNA-binding IscR family transcriptional regulator
VLLDLWADVSEHMRRHLDSFRLSDVVARARNAVPAAAARA